MNYYSNRNSWYNLFFSSLQLRCRSLLIYNFSHMSVLIFDDHLTVLSHVLDFLQGFQFEKKNTKNEKYFATCLSTCFIRCGIIIGLVVLGRFSWNWKGAENILIFFGEKAMDPSWQSLVFGQLLAHFPKCQNELNSFLTDPEISSKAKKVSPLHLFFEQKSLRNTWIVSEKSLNLCQNPLIMCNNF